MSTNIPRNSILNISYDIDHNIYVIDSSKCPQIFHSAKFSNIDSSKCPQIFHPFNIQMTLINSKMVKNVVLMHKSKNSWFPHENGYECFSEIVKFPIDYERGEGNGCFKSWITIRDKHLELRIGLLGKLGKEI